MEYDIECNDLVEGRRMYALAEKIFPICRSITGVGVRETLYVIASYLGKDIPITVYEIASGTKVFDWTVPKEWVIRDGYIEDENHIHIIDFKDNNLHIVGYSDPVDKWVTLDELCDHLYTQKEQPDAIPYVTTYYKSGYGFCMSENQRNNLKTGLYHMFIDSEFISGNIILAEILIPGNSEKELFFSTYDCHPSMANNECSGPCLWTELVKYVSSLKNRRYSYRFVMGPETIGAISYLADNNRFDYLKKNVIAGFNLTCVGDDRDYSIVESRSADTLADRLLSFVLEKSDFVKGKYTRYTFKDRGSDERQYGSPLVNLPFVTFCRSKFCEYPEYHTSLDNLDVISPEGFQGSYKVIKDVIDIVEANDVYKNTLPCEPQLGKRGLYNAVSQKGKKSDSIKLVQDFLAYADGTKDLMDLSVLLNAPINDVIEVSRTLIEQGLIVSVKED